MLEDASGASAAVLNPDPSATQQGSQTEWIIELDQFAIDLTAIVKTSLVLGNLDTPTPGGTGLLTIHTVRLLGPKGPIAHWTFDEIGGTVAADSIGGHDGTLVSDQFEWRPAEGQSGGALWCPGLLDSYVEFPTTGMSADAGTVALWGNLADPQPSHTKYFFGHTTIPPWASRIQLYMDSADTILDLGLGDSHARKRGITTLELGTWYHIALTWDAGNYVVYVNGQALAADTYTGLVEINAVADIANDGDTTGREEGFAGLLDDVRIYDRALSDAEILKLAGN
jgi:hypothetical protein